MVFTAGERRLLFFVTLLLFSGYLVTALRQFGFLPHPATQFQIQEASLADTSVTGPPAFGNRLSGNPTRLRMENHYHESYLDLNLADSLDLILLPGIGPALARRILAQRTRLGGYKSIDDLVKVKGIGPARLNQVRAYLIVVQ